MRENSGYSFSMPPRRQVAFLIWFWFVVSYAISAQSVTTVPVTITVSDPSGARVPHAKIRIVPAPETADRTETDDRGSLSVALKPGGYAFFAEAPGFKSLATHIEVRASGEHQTFSTILQVGETGSPIVSPAISKDELAFFTYPYHEPVAFTPQQVRAMPHVSVSFHNTHTDRDETYSGVRLSEILSKLGAPLGKELRGEALDNCIIATGSDGYGAVLSLAEIDPEFHPGEVIVADMMDGKPLDSLSGPLKLVVSEDKRPARSVRNLTTIELKPVR